MTPIAFRRNGSMWGTTKALIPSQATSFDSALRSRSVTWRVKRGPGNRGLSILRGCSSAVVSQRIEKSAGA
jgi:hypothetical protein